MTAQEDQQPFRDAESWLAAQGIEREPIRVRPEPSGGGGDGDSRTPVHAREAVRLATEAPPPARPPLDATGSAPTDATDDTEDTDASDGARPGHLEDEVRKAVATCQRITSQAPQSEARLRRKLGRRDLPDVVIDLALERCRELGLVDDRAMAAALVEEKRAKGHAVARIRKDLSARGFTREVLDEVLAGAEREDPEAAAFAVARDRAARLRSVEPDTAFRRLVGFLARRGYPEGLCRKVAREVVYADREEQRIAER